MRADVAPRAGGAVAVLRLARAHNGAIAAAGVLAGAWWVGGAAALTADAAATAVAAIGLATFANAFNDLHDVAIDRVAHPDRPLVTGEITPAAARAVATAGAAAGVVLCAVASPPLGIAALATVALMAAYTTHLSATGLPGNLLAAVLSSLPFVFGAAAAGHATRALPLLALAVPLHLAREVAKDIHDAAGDRAHRDTLATSGGRGAVAAYWIAVLAFGAAGGALAVIAPVLGAAALPAFVLAVVAGWRLRAHRYGAPFLLKLAMVLALAALFLLRP